jgi:hypothetical protein
MKMAAFGYWIGEVDDEKIGFLILDKVVQALIGATWLLRGSHFRYHCMI